VNKKILLFGNARGKTTAEEFVTSPVLGDSSVPHDQF